MVKETNGNFHLIWLNWPIGAFRLDARSLAVYRSLARGRVEAVRSERAFLKALPKATHAVCWEFRKEWFPRARRLAVLATPAAGRELLPRDGEMPPGVVRVNGAFHGQIMAETVVACVFAYARGLYWAHDRQREGALWPRSAMSPHCRRVAGTRAVVLGYGKIGRAVGAKLEALGVEVVGIRRRNAAAHRGRQRGFFSQGVAGTADEKTAPQGRRTRRARPRQMKN